jgi:transcription antitermination factor NusG
VPEKVVRDLQVFTESQFKMEVILESLQPGRHLKISKGPLVGLSCEVVEFKEKKGLLVRVNLLRRNILVTLPPEYLANISA